MSSQDGKAACLGARLLEDWQGDNRLTQAQAAQRIGADQGSYSKYVRGHRKPGREQAVRIAQATGGRVPVASWDLLDDPTPAPEGAQEPAA